MDSDDYVGPHISRAIYRNFVKQPAALLLLLLSNAGRFAKLSAPNQTGTHSNKQLHGLGVTLNIYLSKKTLRAFNRR